MSLAIILDSQWFAGLDFCKPLVISYPDEKWFIFFRKPFFIRYNQINQINQSNAKTINYSN